MSLWVCLDCTTAFAVGQPGCPHCGSTIYREEHEMPKISKEGGESAVTNAAADAELAAQEVREDEAAAGEIPPERVDLESRGTDSVEDDGGDDKEPVKPEPVKPEPVKPEPVKAGQQAPASKATTTKNTTK